MVVLQLETSEKDSTPDLYGELGCQCAYEVPVYGEPFQIVYVVEL